MCHTRPKMTRPACTSLKRWAVVRNSPVTGAFSRRALSACCRLLWGVLMAGLLGGGCRGEAGGSTKPHPASETIRDDLGRQVSLLPTPLRIASLSPACTEILFAIGCGERVVLRDTASNYPPSVRRLPSTDPFRLSAEHIAGFRPDLVLLSHADRQQVMLLQRVGLRVASFDPQSVAALLSSIAAIGRLCGRSSATERLLTLMRGELLQVERAVARRRAARPRVYVEIDGSDAARPWTVGGATFVEELVERAGGRNVFATTLSGFGQVSVEAVLRANPDVIVVAADASERGRMLERLKRRPGWSRLRALERSAVVDWIDEATLSRPGPRVTAGLVALARAMGRYATGISALQ